MERTLTLLERKLKKIRNARKTGKYENGLFGFKACKESIKFKLKTTGKNLNEIYGELVNRGLTEIGFNIFMIVACEEMMEKESA